MCRRNFLAYRKYEESLNSIYKNYIDSIESTMISATYGTSILDCVFTKNLNLVISQEDIDNCVGEQRYTELENAVINFCQQHNVCLKILRYPLYISVEIDMLRNYRVIYA